MKRIFLLLLFFLGSSFFVNAQITNPAPYCIATFDDMDGGFAVEDAIKSVSIGTLNNVTNAQYALPHYVFYNNLAAPALTKGSSYTLTVVFDVHGGCGYGVWIDYNQNNIFEATEKVAGTTSGNILDMSTNTTIAQSVLIPSTATTGNTRMRVRIVEDDTYNMDNNYVIAACNAGTSSTDVMDWGETEDYVVNIASSGGCTPVAITSQPTASQSACAPGGASFTVVAATGTAPITYQWQYYNGSTWNSVVNGTPAGSTYANATVATMTVAGISSAGTYQYRCYLTNCSGANNATSATASLVINSKPTSPTVGIITHPTCATATGSVVLSGLPSSGTWTLTRTPGSVTTTGTGTSTTITGLSAGTYTYTVTNASSCVSTSSSSIVINAAPSAPTAPTVGTITQPTCATAMGSVVLNGLPSSGTWTLTRTPGSVTTTGTGTSTTTTGLAAGTYTYTVTNASSCVSSSSSSIVINAQPTAPTAPMVGTITQPTCATATGSVVLSGLPSSGTWTLTRTPGSVTTTGTGTSTTITGLSAGTYSYTVINASSCVSSSSSNIVINAQPATPTAQFSYTTNGLTVTFTNTSTGASSYSWNIGSYVTSDANPVHSFPSNGQYTVVLTANNQGCTSTYSQTITISGVEIETADLNNQVMIYPNPTNGIVTISLNDQPNSGMLSVFDMMGRVVFQREINEKKVTMDLTPLSPGIYEFQFNLDRKIIHQRIVIQNIK